MQEKETIIVEDSAVAPITTTNEYSSAPQPKNYRRPLGHGYADGELFQDARGRTYARVNGTIYRARRK